MTTIERSNVAKIRPVPVTEEAPEVTAPDTREPSLEEVRGALAGHVDDRLETLYGHLSAHLDRVARDVLVSGRRVETELASAIGVGSSRVEERVTERAARLEDGLEALAELVLGRLEASTAAMEQLATDVRALGERIDRLDARSADAGAAEARPIALPAPPRRRWRR